ncbi:hypothetical protein [Cellulomonas sp. ES6]|uniref:hypothetical protein n=1 Tax=Cellulomonas sp. ES6 TaxID=3039384 RepID=UPI0024B7F831|nr:hypothetical protein [Cellulomonas sp. ES6]WHP16937.1 hypothetical protein P9841_15235 [Cellulomonas sp. ES6]
MDAPRPDAAGASDQEADVDEQQHPHPQPGDAGDDEAFARLRAADPAADARLDAGALRAEVARRTAGDGAAPRDGADVPPDGATVTTLAGRRRSRWLQVAAVGVGAALLAGGGGYAIGAAGDGGDDLAGTAGPIVLGQGGATGLSGAADGPETAAGADAMRIAPGFGSGRAEFTAQGLPDDAGTAHAWALDAASVFSAETVARVAAALGVTGEPRLQWGAWTVGPDDGSGPSVSLQPDGTASISYYDPTRDPWACTASAADEPGLPEAGGGTEGAEGTDGTDGTDGTAPAPGDVATIEPGLVDPGVPVDPSASCDPAAGGDAPTGDAAVAAARDLLAELGVDPDGFVYEVADAGTPRASTVLADQVVDGQRTGLAWNLTLVDGGVQSLYGGLAPLVDLGEYPVVGAATAAARLEDPRFGGGWGGVMPLARAEASDDAAVTADPSADPTVPPTATPGAAIAWPVQHVTLTGARLGVTVLYQPDGAALLVPAYELTDTDGGTWSVVAVAEEQLDFAG